MAYTMRRFSFNLHQNILRNILYIFDPDNEEASKHSALYLFYTILHWSLVEPYCILAKL